MLSRTLRRSSFTPAAVAMVLAFAALGGTAARARAQQPDPAAAAPAPLPFVLPCDGYRSGLRGRGNFGVLVTGRDSPFAGSHHLAEDVWLPAGTEVRSVADGVVRYSDFSPSWKDAAGRMHWNLGNVIVIEHTLKRSIDGLDAVCSLYVHLAADRRVATGDVVRRGQVLGRIGKDRSEENGLYPAHLHFGLHREPYLQIPPRVAARTRDHGAHDRPRDGRGPAAARRDRDPPARRDHRARAGEGRRCQLPALVARRQHRTGQEASRHHGLVSGLRQPRRRRRMAVSVAVDRSARCARANEVSAPCHALRGGGARIDYDRAQEVRALKWVTRRGIRVNRAATAWLIRRFVDPAAEFLFVDPGEVARVQADQGAIGFDAPGARYPHDDANHRCSFEALAREHRPHDPALAALARIVHGADFAREVGLTPESAGLRAISEGFPLVTADDHDTVAKASFLYDALYAALASRNGDQPPTRVGRT